MSHPNWTPVCRLEAILPGTGVCALLDGRQVAIFRPRDDETLYALDNRDPFGQANVLSRGLIGETQEELYVASPLKKQRFRLRDGQCLDDAAFAVASYPVRVSGGQIEVAL